ncbi:MAG: TldD/PmbA family protein [Alphaproteobacteria bacterium]|nr:TldD/PmbA family protein [Alphaproteobacteria bacterium]
MTELLDIAADLVARVRKLGATAADAMAIDQNELSISIRNGEVENMERSEAKGIGLRVFAGQSSAIVSGSVLTAESLQKLAERGLAMAKAAPPDEFAGLADPSQLAKDDLDLDMVSQEQPSIEQLKAMAIEAEQRGLAVQGVSKSIGSGASASGYLVALSSTNGFSRSYRRTGFGLSASVISGEGVDMVRDYDGTSANHFIDLETPEKIGRTAGERAVAKRNAQKLTSRSASVIFDRRVSASLIGHLAGAINGAAIARGVSFLKDDLGKAIFKSNIDIVDDPLRLRGPASRAFDGEGLAVQRRLLIDKGVLTGWILDLRSSRQLGLAPTGQGARGMASQPSPSTSNVHMEPGVESPAAMMKALGSGLLVTEFIGASINSSTGDYSRGVSGFWFENGEIAYPVSEVTVAGNLKDMFANLVPADDLIFKGATNAPSCLVEGMTIAGK